MRTEIIFLLSFPLSSSSLSWLVVEEWKGKPFWDRRRWWQFPCKLQMEHRSFLQEELCDLQFCCRLFLCLAAALFWCAVAVLVQETDRGTECVHHQLSLMCSGGEDVHTAHWAWGGVGQQLEHSADFQQCHGMAPILLWCSVKALGCWYTMWKRATCIEIFVKGSMLDNCLSCADELGERLKQRESLNHGNRVLLFWIIPFLTIRGVCYAIVDFWRSVLGNTEEISNLL